MPSSDQDDTTTASASDSETSYVPRIPTSPLSPPAETTRMPVNSSRSRGELPTARYNSSAVLRYLLSRLDEMIQEIEIRTAVLNEAQAACNNRIDELEQLVARLQVRSEVQATRIQRTRTADRTLANTHRQEMTAALTK
ncbi:hypothetical protein Bca4012_026452 [Brassica carinata]|uniref:Uncharacterized protein n=1 Tax=Brassica carinata TaxID=52824 RepID=A0A8X7VIB5_BRACI|nr:hypothetical protein Bca52824_023496 [Brassica carinata]